jgi:outer membrane protein assembly factor BamB
MKSMTITTSNVTPSPPVRLWPGILIVAVVWAARLAAPAVAGPLEELMVRGFSSLGGTLAVAIWWLFFSRVSRRERWAIAGVMVAAASVPLVLGHESIGVFWLVMYALPVLCLALVASTAAARGLAKRRALIAGAILIAGLPWTGVRIAGINGAGIAEFHWRWEQTPEQRLLGSEVARPAAAPAAAAAPAPDLAVEPSLDGRAAETAAGAAAVPAPVAPAIRSVWPGFRGSRRDGVIAGVRIGTDWRTAPPVALWRRPIGPGWSSFAVAGDILYTQEQRGDDEIVSAYRVSTGEPVWMHKDAARFYETNGGAGPRATPTIDGGRVYSLGATGILNALDARSGRVVWSRDAAAATGAPVPIWGFSGSPIVAADLVIVALGGMLAAFDLATGEPRWQAGSGDGYSSPHLATIAGAPQVLLMGGTGTTSIALPDGKPLWSHPWPTGGATVVQPGVAPDGDLLLGSTSGLRRVAFTQGADGWNVAERWTSNGLKPYFNDFVVHKGHAYGFDGAILAAVNLQDGVRAWKGGRYGQGQLVLLPDQDVLLVLSEEGELVLVQATPERFIEIARAPGITGKTWNHPVVVGDLLLVRNGEEMAAFRLPAAERRSL